MQKVVEEAAVPARYAQDVRKYLKKIQPLMGLREWSVYVAAYYDEEESHAASISALPNVREATLFLGTMWEHLTDEVRGKTLVHELMHCRTAHLDQVISRAELPDIFEAVIDDAMELLVEDVARDWYPCLPPFEGRD